MVRVFTHGAMSRRIDPSWGEPIELFLVLASAPLGRGMCYPGAYKRTFVVNRIE